MAVRSSLSLRINKSMSDILIFFNSANYRIGALSLLCLIHQQPPPLSGDLLPGI